jgi:predicted Zn-dependent protease
LCEYELNLDARALADFEAAKNLGVQKSDELPRVLRYHEAMLLLRQGHFESANDALRFLVKQGVHSDQLDAALGMSALMILPRNAPADGTVERQILSRVGQAEALSLANKYDEARKAYGDLTREFPQSPNLHYAYGRCLLAAQDPDAAVEEFRKEIELDPAHARSRLQIAATYYRVNSPAGIPYVQEVLRLHPNYAFAHYLLGLLYLDSGDSGNAIVQIEAARKLKHGIPEFSFALGNAYAKAGRKLEAAKARAEFRRLIAREGSANELGAGAEFVTLDPKKMDGEIPAGPHE